MGFGWQLPTLWDLLTLCLFAGHYFTSLHAQNDPIPPSTNSSAVDAHALLRFKQSIQSDPNGFLSDWTLQAASNNNSYCHWFGITCSTNSRVVAVNLRSCGLIAPLPLSALVTSLQQLQELHLAGNYFHGTVEAAADDTSFSISCSALSVLDISSNSLNGSFPSLFLQHCKALTHLNLSHNSFAGPILMSWPSSLNFTSDQQNVAGAPLPANITTCANLTVLDLSTNLLTGSIPAYLGSCTSLRHLNLSSNAFLGNFPTTLTSLVNLEVLVLSKNNLTGSIPPDLGSSLRQLRELDLSANDLIGTIPSSLSSLSSLQYLNLGSNALTGDFPMAVVSQMPSLRMLILSFNQLTGPLPTILTNSSSLEVLDLSANSFTGSIPGALCIPSLRRLMLSDNDLSGAVPLESCSNVVAIDVSCNLLTRAFPTPLPRLPYMREIIMWGNFIEQEIPADICHAAPQLWLLVLNVNLINGTIPPTLANCSSLEWLSLSNNRLTGSIPPELGLMERINFLHLNNNSLSGTIPPTLGDCRYLVWVDLRSNELEGTIPVELAKQAGKVIKGNLDTSLRFAFYKHLRGDVCVKYGLGSVLTMRGVRPSRLSRIPSFRSCNLTRLYTDIVPYYIPGPPGSSLGGSYTYLDVGYNKLVGIIPPELGALTYLTVLSVSYNNLTGTIPFTLANLIRCSILHLDHNHLQGPIPPGLSELGIMNQLDLSNNNLSGSIPESGKLQTFPASSFADNPYLCGTPLSQCDADVLAYDGTPPSGDSSAGSLSFRHRSQRQPAMVALTVICVIFLVSIVTYLVALGFRNFTEKQQHMREQVHENSMDKLPMNSTPSSSACHRPSARKSSANPLSINIAAFEISSLRRISYKELQKATKGFSDEAQIGSGGFGKVYKATLEDGTIVAVKKLCHPIDDRGELRDFNAEIETIGKIKHRNLVPLLGYCKEAEERLLIYEYMENGSLHSWLHDKDKKPDGAGDIGQPGSSASGLSWESRKRIAFGTANGLLFLHKECFPHILHRDLKPANVLLDDALEARVADFGMARLVSAFETHLSVSTLVGTPGYVPPEYCGQLRCTEKGDVYSFGVVLLELVTGKQAGWSSTPTDEEQGGVDLVGWAKRHVREGRGKEMLDERALKGPAVSQRPAESTSTSSSSSSCPLAHVQEVQMVDIERREREMLRYLYIACRCVEDRPELRPPMQDIVAAFRRLEPAGCDLDLLH